MANPARLTSGMNMRAIIFSRPRKWTTTSRTKSVCGARFARGLHVITFNREDPDERARADACYRKMSEEVAKRGVFVGRAPLDYHDMHFAQTMPGFRQACTAIKKALDPKGVIAPGRYGIN